MQPKKSIVFIDARNLLGGWWQYCRDNGHVKLDVNTEKEILLKKIGYSKLLKRVAGETDLIRGYFYDAVPEPIGADAQRFHDMLRTNEITVVTKPLKFKTVSCKHRKKTDHNMPYQKGVDVAMVTDIMNLAVENAYDVAIVVSGDNDFVEALKHVKGKGKKVWVVSFRNSLGEDTMRVADKVIQLEKIFNDITLQ